MKRGRIRNPPFKIVLLSLLLLLLFSSSPLELTISAATKGIRYEFLFKLPTRNAGSIRRVLWDPPSQQLYVLRESPNMIQVHDQYGSLLYTVENKAFVSPGDMAVDPRGTLYVADTQLNQILEVDERGAFADPVVLKGADEEIWPRSIAIDPHGDLYVVDAKGNRLLAFRGGFLLFTVVGSQYKYEEKVALFSKVRTGRDGKILLLAPLAGKVLVFNDEGKFLFDFGDPGGTSKKLAVPTDMAENEDGIFSVVDVQRHAVLFYDEKGNYLTEGFSPGLDDGTFLAPRCITFVPGNVLYIADGTGRIQAFGRKR